MSNVSNFAADHLRVLVTGVDAAIARDVVRLVVEEGAEVMAADKNAGRLARLHREVGLSRQRLSTLVLDLDDPEQLRAWRGAQSGRALQLMICCCRGGSGGAAHGDVALGHDVPRRCPSLTARRELNPARFLHAEPLRHTIFDRALAVLRPPTLRRMVSRGSAGRLPSLPKARLRLVPVQPAASADAA